MIDRGTSPFASPPKNKPGFWNRYTPYHIAIGALGTAVVGGGLYYLNSKSTPKPKHTNLTIPKTDFVIPGVQPTLYPNYRVWRSEELERNKKYMHTPTPTPVTTPSNREPLDL